MDTECSPDFIAKYGPGLPKGEVADLIEVRLLTSCFADIFLHQLKKLLEEMTLDDYRALSASDLQDAIDLIDDLQDIKHETLIPLNEGYL